MNSNPLRAVGLAFCAVAQCALGQQAEVAKPVGRFTFGGDIRARYEYLDNIPKGGTIVPSTTYDEFSRFRTRLWADMRATDELSARIKIANEFRFYGNSPANRGRFEFPDEMYLDNVYVEWKKDDYGLKVGRQDIYRGAGRVLYEGTPADGSRSGFYDAAIFTLNFAQKSAVEFMGIYDHYRDDLTMGSTEVGVYDLTKFIGGNPYSKMNESALAAYATIREFETIPLETYWIWKDETDFYGKGVNYPGRDFHTAGMRMLPNLTDWLSAEVEAAYQFGSVDAADAYQSRDISAGMLYAGLTCKPVDALWSPSLRGGVLYLSGDKDNYYGTADGTTDTGWNPVFGRAPWSSDIPLYMYEMARWSNLIYPQAELIVKPAKGHSLGVECGPMYAVEKDYGATDDYRGFFARVKYGFPLPSAGGIDFNGYLAGDTLVYGDYYDTEEDAATTMRFEIMAKF